MGHGKERKEDTIEGRSCVGLTRRRGKLARMRGEWVARQPISCETGWSTQIIYHFYSRLYFILRIVHQMMKHMTLLNTPSIS